VDGASGAALEEQATGGETSPLIDDAVLRNIARIGSDGGALLARICQLYCQQAPKLLSDLRDVAGHGELSDAAHAAHALKSLCLNVGALRAGNLCDAIETAAAGGDAIPPAMISCVTETIDATVRALPGAAERIKSALAPPVRAVA
jgi:HPt (histidine-containing phosphotransfer) domain-containing protein